MKEDNGNKSGPGRIYFFRSESATSTVIGAVLLLAIVFSVFSIVRIGYIPEWKSDAEYSHMDDVWEDMADLKSKIDMMSIVLASNPNSSYLNSSDPDSSSPQLVMSVPFHMGGGSIPLIGSIKSSGTLAVNKDPCIMSIIVNPDSDSGHYFKSINCGTVTYNSQNRYYVDQVFSYEGGALILGQREQSAMMLYPSIRFSRTSANEYNVTINAVRIFEKEYYPPDVISSNSGCSLSLAGLDYKPLYDSDRDNFGNIESFILTIYTLNPEAWEQYLEKTIDDTGIDPGEYTLVSSESSNSVRLTFPSTSDSTKTKEASTPDILKRLYVSETVVKAEPGIGLN
ncbi:hypothetical protein [Methanosarcina sp. 2.H.A.1B.4]|uniref:hypothetical protein n=1 Tax=Methanosarcina sp. 2.H.A.1B.4 TaxID=1483600 RepID=UPI000621AF52|nr:hypothetical protein [Methanosarcina sp. 2.H.A.1B.4]KKG11444.1 hypothetical protein EO92_10800 [Methanosarcina sp. 2.H.A.1B.4]